MFTLRKFSLSSLKNPALQTLFRGTNYSTAKPTVVLQSANDQNVFHDTNPKDNVKTSVAQQITKVKDHKSSSLVAAVFASLQDDNANNIKEQKVTFNDKRINQAKTISELLTIAADNGLSRNLALKIVSILAQWSTEGKINLSDFETDPRFVKICRILSRTNNKPRGPPRMPRGDDLSMVLGVTGDDEAAKLVGSITLPQMVKVMSSLTQKKRRSTPLLRSLAYNISSSVTKLDLKQCADLLYSMTILNFPEPVLLERISNDALEVLASNSDRSAVVGSILTSIGLMRYKDTGLLDALSEWILKHSDICRAQDIFTLFLTLGILNYHPENSENLYKMLIPQLNISDAQKTSNWLDVVWSLVILNQATENHLLSIFDPEFIEKLHGNTGINMSSKIKLLNINAAAKYLIPHYKGPIMTNVAQEKSLQLTRTKEKQVMVSAVLDSLGSLLPSQTYLRSNINTGMGFYIDGECVIDKKCNPLPVDSTTDDCIRVAILVYDYHDMCRNTCIPHGGNDLCERLLKAQGYKIMIIPYTDFNPRDKLLQRVQFIEKQFKLIASST